MTGIRRASAADADVVGALLHAFNSEFATPTPGAAVLAERLDRLAADDRLVVLLAGDPAVGLAVVSFRPTVWSDGPAALLDELYVRPEHRRRRLGHQLLAAVEDLVRERDGEALEIEVDGEDTDARRFYTAHGYSCTEPGRTDPALVYRRELGTP